MNPFQAVSCSLLAVWLVLFGVTVAYTPYLTPQLVTTNKTDCLISHNAKRALHCVPDLQWDDSLVPGAAAWALYHAKKSKVGMEHSKGNGGKYSENIFYKFANPVGTLATCEDAVRWWYDEIRFYDYKNPGFNLPAAHFTQLIWKKSTKVGVAMSAHTRGPYTYTFVVAHYSVPGNIKGTFAYNVPNLKCKTAPIPYIKPQILQLNKRKCLRAHNAKRALHGVRRLQWDSNLARGAAAWALKIARDPSVLQQSSPGNGRGYRENTYYSSAAPPGTVSSCEATVQAWYNEIKDYNFRRPGFQRKAAYFTQLIWKSSTKVGVGLAVVTKTVGTKTLTYTYIVARYAPPGNVYGRFAKNVPNLRSKRPCRPCPTDAVKYSSAQKIKFNIASCLTSHNAKRALHGVPKLRWDRRLASGAAQWALIQARKTSKRVRMRVSPGNGRSYRENSYWYAGPIGKVFTCNDAVKFWYSQIKNYNFNRPGFRGNAQSFTQLIWKSSTKVGVGIAAVSRNGYTYTFIVAQYSPPGNIYRTFRRNVPRPRRG